MRFQCKLNIKRLKPASCQNVLSVTRGKKLFNDSQICRSTLLDKQDGLSQIFVKKQKV